MSIKVELNLTFPGIDPTCAYTENLVTNDCDNFCPETFAYDALGFSNDGATTTLDFDIDVVAASTAMAVNLGILPLDHLLEVPIDNNRNKLLKHLYQNKVINDDILNNTLSYFDTQYAPTTPIYW